MKKNRIIYITAIVFLIVLNIFIPSRILLILPVSAAILPVFTLAGAFSAQRSLRFYNRQQAKNIYRGDVFGITISAVCRNPFSLAYLKIFLGCRNRGGTDISEKTEYLLIYGKIKLMIEENMTCRIRGTNSAGVVETHIYDVLGLFKFKKTFKPEEEIFAYVRITDTEGLEIKSGVFGDADMTHNSLQKDKNMVSHIRKYEYGDNMKHIHWKLSLKTNGLVSKEFEPVRDKGLIIFLDLSGKNNAETEEKILSQCLGAAREACLADIFVRIIYFSEGVEMKEIRSRDDFDGIYRTLSDISFGSAENAAGLISYYVKNKNYDCNFLLVTDYPCDGLENLLSDIRIGGGWIKTIYVGNGG